MSYYSYNSRYMGSTSASQAQAQAELEAARRRQQSVYQAPPPMSAVSPPVGVYKAQLIVPADAYPGKTIRINVKGSEYMVQLPANARPGQRIMIQVPIISQPTAAAIPYQQPPPVPAIQYATPAAQTIPYAQYADIPPTVSSTTAIAPPPAQKPTTMPPPAQKPLPPPPPQKPTSIPPPAQKPASMPPPAQKPSSIPPPAQKPTSMPPPAQKPSSIPPPAQKPTSMPPPAQRPNESPSLSTEQVIISAYPSSSNLFANVSAPPASAFGSVGSINGRLELSQALSHQPNSIITLVVNKNHLIQPDNAAIYEEHGIISVYEGETVTLLEGDITTGLPAPYQDYVLVETDDGRIGKVAKQALELK